MKSGIRYCLVVIFSAWGIFPCQSSSGNQTLLVLGDSISAAYGLPVEQGWVSLLQQRLDEQGWRNIDVINASISGDTSASGRQRIGELLRRHEPDIVVIELGGNDGLQGKDLGAMKQNLQAIIDQAAAAGAKLVLAGMKIPPNYGPAFTRAFENVYAALALENSTGYVPFLLEGVGGHQDMMQADGIHPNARAQQRILDNAWPVLLELLRLP